MTANVCGWNGKGWFAVIGLAFALRAAEGSLREGGRAGFAAEGWRGGVRMVRTEL